MADNPEILDLNKIKPKKRIVKLLDKEIDVSQIPSKITLRVIENEDKLSRENPEALGLVLDITTDIIKLQNEDEGITKEWILENTNFEQLYRLIEFIMENAQEKINERAENTKN